MKLWTLDFRADAEMRWNEYICMRKGHKLGGRGQSGLNANVPSSSYIEGVALNVIILRGIVFGR